MNMNKRVKYPNRTVYFGVQTGLVDVKAQAEHVERERKARLAYYIMDDLVSFDRADTLEDFKEEFDITC